MTVGDACLSAEWQLWVAEQLILGRTREEVVAELVAGGSPQGAARASVEAIWTQPGTIAGRNLQARHARAHREHRLRHTSYRDCRVPERLEVTPGEFFGVHVAHGVPVVIRGWCSSWPAASWTPAGLAERFGELPVQVCEGRDAEPDYDRDWRRFATEMSMASFVERLGRPGNDLYMLGNQNNLDEGLTELLEDLRPDPEIVHVDFLRRNCSMWMGPGGTRTAAHYDPTNILYSQLYGRKRFYLLPPDAPGCAENERACYAVGVSLPEREDVWSVTLGPGDSLLIPVGWWHEVHALSPNISVATVALRCPNNFDWFRDGSTWTGPDLRG